MHLPSASAKQSDNLMASSVKGLLDAPDRSKRTANTGWRYLQCSHTLDELKVLIPPRTSSLYTKLLKAEDHESKQNTPDSAKELQYIHYLKDAMVKKCTKLVDKQLKSDPDLQLGDRKIMSFTVPAHFTLKRLEQWYEQRRVVRDAPLETTREGHSRRRRADFYVENSDASSFKRDRGHTANGTEHPTGRRMAQTVQESLGNDGRLPADNQDSIHSPRRNLQNITSNHKQSSMLSHDGLSQSGKVIPHNSTPSAELQTSLTGRSNGRPQYYSNGDALGSTHNPYFDPNYTLAARSPVAEHGIIPPSPTHPLNPPAMNSPRYDPTLIPGQTRSDPTDRVIRSAVDPSHLKSRFDAAYTSQTPRAESSRRSSLPRRTSTSSTTKLSPPSVTASQLHTGSPNTTRIQMRKSYTIGHPIHGTTQGDGMSPPVADIEHRRRATLDSGDTERSIPRHKAYMYRTTEALVADSIRLHGQQPLHAGTTSYPDKPRNAQVGVHPRQNNNATYNGLSPMNAAQAQLSPLGLASTVSSASYTGSPKQRSPISDRLSVPSSSPQIPQDVSSSKPLQHRRASPIPPSPNSYPDHPSSRTHVRGTSVDSSKFPPVVPRELVAPSAARRRSSDRRDSNAPGNHANGIAMPTVYEQNTQQGESAEVKAEKVVQSNDNYPEEHAIAASHTPRTNNVRKVQSPAQRNDILEYEAPMNIWKTNGPIKPVSTRSSIYTSGESDGGPVIPDASLIMDAVIMRAREKPHRRQLVPFLSSSEENTSYRPTDVDTDFSSDSSDSEEERGRQGNGSMPYGCIRRDRDGYTSEAGSVAGSVRSRASSRAPSRPPSRGILKRSNSTCSQRSGKSVRLEITEDRVALEEAREAEEAVNKARDKLKEARQKKAMNVEGADLDAYKAMEQMKSAESVLEAKVATYEGILKEQKTKRKALEKEEPVYV